MKTRSPTGLAELGRYAGLGMQFAASVLLFGAAGWWLDGRVGTRPWLFVVGLLLGAVLAFVSLLRAVANDRSSPPPPH